MYRRSKLNPEEKSELVQVVLEHVYDLCIHQYGCRVIQKLFDNCSDEEKNEMLSEINKYIIELCQDQYGNYVIQHVLENRISGIECSEIFEALKGKIFEMSIHKFASNVIERCLHFGSKKQRDAIIDEIISIDDSVHNSLLGLVKDKFGNYVVQKMIEYSEQEKKEVIIKRIISSQALKKRDGFSKHVINFIEKMGFNAATGQMKTMNFNVMSNNNFIQRNLNEQE